MATAVAAGLTQGVAGTGKIARCPKCGHSNDADAKFCDECGASVSTACPSCGQFNDHDAKFWPLHANSWVNSGSEREPKL
ncbi:MAG: zinc ribbon domain-containing protein [candidate division Zixibacteria bacterium]|nr:zinc ribbon domain-containing protein [candidate division Zixibacteria bacterium]